MAASPVAVPATLVGPGYLFLAPLASTLPTNTVAGGVFTDTWPVAWLPLGATTEGTEFAYTVETEAIEGAEFFDPLSYSTTSREGSVTFNLLNFSLTNARRAFNGGVAALTPVSGTGATALYEVSPPAPGTEVRAMLGFESLDNTFRAVFPQVLQGGEVGSSFRKAPDTTSIGFEYKLEVPTSGVLVGKPFAFYGAGSARG